MRPSQLNNFFNNEGPDIVDDEEMMDVGNEGI